MPDPVQNIIDKEEKEEVVEKKPDASNAEVVEAIKEVKDALTKSGDKSPSKEEIRAAIKEKTGFTDAQLDVVEQMNKAVSNQSSSKVAELQEKVAWAEFKDDIGGKIDPSIEKMMKEELKQYDVVLRGDKVLLQKVYFLSKGILADKAEKAKRADPNNNDKPNDADNIVKRTIMNDTPGSAKGLDSSAKNNGNGNGNLSDDEKSIAKRMNISEDDYAKAKATKFVGQLKGK